VRISLRMVVILLAILTIAMTGAAVYAYVDSLSQPVSFSQPADGAIISACEVDEVPPYGVLITDPHPILIEAVKNPGKLMYLGNAPPEDYEAVIEQIPDRTITYYVEYEGRYYVIGVSEVTIGLEPSLLNQLPVGFSALAVCWVVVGYSYHRKKKG